MYTHRDSVELQLLGSEMCLVTSHLCISKIVPGKYQSKNRELEVLDQKELWCIPDRNQSQVFRKSKWRGKGMNFRALSPHALDAI